MDHVRGVALERERHLQSVLADIEKVAAVLLASDFEAPVRHDGARAGTAPETQPSFSGLAFFLLLPLMKRTLTISLDTDWLYRKAGAPVGRWLVERTGLARVRAERGSRALLAGWLEQVFRPHRPQGILARSWTTGE